MVLLHKPSVDYWRTKPYTAPSFIFLSTLFLGVDPWNARISPAVWSANAATVSAAVCLLLQVVAFLLHAAQKAVKACLL